MRSPRSSTSLLLVLLGVSLPASAVAGTGTGGASPPAGGHNVPATGGTTPGQPSGSGGPITGGTTPGQASEEPAQPEPNHSTPPATTTPGAAVLVNGKARAPRNAPLAVKRAIRAGNRLQNKPYRFGGGHAVVEDTAYDCSGTVSYTLIHGGLLNGPLNSGGLMKWGAAGAGKWITVYANPNHTFVIIAGLRLDTGGSDVRGPRWRVEPRPTGAYVARHPAGL
ncbi:MAG: hypothetical protein QOJ07_3815 [Thermoleophilaceae bacterium]|jgi:hypothetical protein|nr:hypothetical protein [Thermoleophilaceae bacterium]